MLQYLVIVCIFGLAVSQPGDHGHNNLVDQTFTRMDNNTDGLLEIQELVGYLMSYDDNGDGSVSKAEFLANTHATPDIAGKLFLYLDPDGNGQIDKSTLGSEWVKMDENLNGEVSKIEFQQYLSNLLAKMQNPAPVGK